jgi:hypothetical protein
LALTREYLDGALDDAPPSTRLLVTKAAATIAAAMNTRTLRPPSAPETTQTELSFAHPHGAIAFKPHRRRIAVSHPTVLIPIQRKRNV